MLLFAHGVIIFMDDSILPSLPGVNVVRKVILESSVV